MIAGGWGAVHVDSAEAYNREEFRVRLEARRAEREVRREERRAEREARRRERDQQSEEPVDSVCGCRARVKNADPVVQWQDGKLMIIPYVDLNIRVKGGDINTRWKLDLKSEGSTAFDVDGGKVTVAGNNSWGGACMDTRWDIKGQKLPAISVGSLARSMFGADSEVKGQVSIKTKVSGCDVDDDADEFRIKIGPFGSIRVR